MISSKIVFHIRVISLVIILASVVTFTGCSEQYKKLNVTKSGIKFSFEYPLSYTLFNNNFNNGDPLIIPRYLPDSQKQEADREIRIETFITNLEYPNANILLNQFLETVDIYWEQFELLEHSKVQVSGIDGEMIVFSGRFETSFINLSQLKGWEIYLDCKGQILTLAFYSKIDVADEVESEFKHFIKSFKFLD